MLKPRHTIAPSYAFFNFKLTSSTHNFNIDWQAQCPSFERRQCTTSQTCASTQTQNAQRRSLCVACFDLLAQYCFDEEEHVAQATVINTNRHASIRAMHSTCQPCKHNIQLHTGGNAQQVNSNDANLPIQGLVCGLLICNAIFPGQNHNVLRTHRCHRSSRHASS